MKILTRSEVAELLGLSTKTVTKMIQDKGMPMSLIGKEWKGCRDDIVAWVRSQYPEKYKEALDRAGATTSSIRTRGQMSSEEFGIVESRSGQRRVVEGKEYVKFKFHHTIGEEELVAIQHRGSCSFEQIKKELAI